MKNITTLEEIDIILKVEGEKLKKFELLYRLRYMPETGKIGIVLKNGSTVYPLIFSVPAKGMPGLELSDLFSGDASPKETIHTFLNRAQFPSPLKISEDAILNGKEGSVFIGKKSFYLDTKNFPEIIFRVKGEFVKL
ncbi:MAG TPA: hypothetical protein P5232_02665 [Candidatus Moranbacteria bacterium]|nr:hypothetical protein [Candidatus Moranbacteria bacterium]